MATMHDSDEAFERALLRSAASDAAPAGSTERGFERFSATVATLAAARGVATTAPKSRVTRWLRAASLVTLGALGGAAIAFSFPSPRVAVDVPTFVVITSASVSATIDVPAPPPVTALPIVPRALRVIGSADAPTLAAEVRAIDDARSDLARSSPDDAIARVDRYRREFPLGKLAPEADVVVIEALVAKGERARVASEAARFVARHPSSPERARVEELARSVR